MPLDIYDNQGNHLGIICDRYLDEYNVYMVAITDLTADDISFNEDKMKKHMAGVLKVKGIFGKVDEDRLREEIENLRMSEENQRFQQLPYADFLKYLFFRNYSGKKLKEYLELDGLHEDRIKGYILYDMKKAEVYNGRLFISDNVDYIGELIDDKLIPKNESPYLIDQRKDERIYSIKPIFAKVAGYPVFSTDIMGFGEGVVLGADLADLGGRNHSHETILKVISGNFHGNVILPYIVYAKKDREFQLYVAENRIEMVFCDGIIYRI